MSHILKTGHKNIVATRKKGFPSSLPDKKGDKEMMHEHGMQYGMMQQKDMLMMEMWETLTDDQKKTLLKRMLDSKIIMKEGMIKHFQFKIETMRMIKSMLDAC